MAETKNSTDAGTIERLSKRGEEALARLVDEVGKNELVADALGRAASAKGKLDDGARRALATVGLAPMDEVETLRKQVASLERRLAKLEGGGSTAKPKATARKKPAAGAKKATSTRRKATGGSGSTASG